MWLELRLTSDTKLNWRMMIPNVRTVEIISSKYRFGIIDVIV